MNLNKNERFKDYEKLLEESKENLNRSIKNKWQLDGFCYMLKRIRPGCNIADYEELLQYKPKHIKKPDSEAWFKCNPNGEEASKRIQIVEEILKTK
ncbi:hypothetical protein [Methanoculleus sp.]|uniref:hypothetical protein n=1 Tax=Methanoculleus sp. TaxID=90427 RepID=UPI0025E20FF1|nr:hypothetical protein [Methanoculleus sp.]MCK9320121.1 hypothetical protein [Methanoculleus sp.]